MKEIGDAARHLLRARARELAGRGEARDRTAVGGLVVLVHIGKEHMALPIDVIRTVMPAPPITQVPGLPTWMPGLVQLRGRIVSVVDPAALFGLSAGANATYLALLERDHRPLGLLVATVAGVRQIYADEVAERVEAGTQDGSLPVSFTTRDLVAVLDVERLFALADCRAGAPADSPRHPGLGSTP